MPGGLGTLLGPTDAMPSPPEKNTIDAALARSLMPTAPIPATEHNLPVIQMERYACGLDFFSF
jgi:hypothetical protein